MYCEYVSIVQGKLWKELWIDAKTSQESHGILIPKKCTNPDACIHTQIGDKYYFSLKTHRSIFANDNFFSIISTKGLQKGNKIFIVQSMFHTELWEIYFSLIMYVYKSARVFLCVSIKGDKMCILLVAWEFLHSQVVFIFLFLDYR